MIRQPGPRPKVAAIFTELRFRSHAYNILENFFRPYLFDGRLVDPGVDIVSFYADQFPDHKVVVEGYASADGSEQNNLQLSYRRATRAKATLVKHGIDDARITVQAFGEYRPNLDGDIDRDRRVIVKVQGVAACPQKEE